jgi:hypothetical protein
MAMPSALSIQVDWNVYQNFYANLAIIKGFGHGNNAGVIRPDMYSITPRYETMWGKVSIPFSVLYYNQWHPRIGLALRIGYFYVGGDEPWGLLKLSNLENVDFYIGAHFSILKKPVKPASATQGQ